MKLRCSSSQLFVGGWGELTSFLDTLDSSIGDSPIHRLDGVLGAVDGGFASEGGGGEEPVASQGQRFTRNGTEDVHSWN